VKKCKDCKYNKPEGKHFRCEVQGHLTDWNQNNCKDCEDFEVKKRSKNETI